MPAKIVVTESKGGSRISLLSPSGKVLLGSSVFSEPRAKGATLRVLKGMLADVVVEDHTLATKPKGKPEAKAESVVATRTRRPSATRPATKASSAAATTATPKPRGRKPAGAVAATVSPEVTTASVVAAAPKTRTSRKAAPSASRRTRTTKA